jgi:hypothetical protein
MQAAKEKEDAAENEGDNHAKKRRLDSHAKKRGSTATKTRAAEEVCVVEELSFGRKDQHRLMHPARRADKTKKKRR